MYHLNRSYLSSSSSLLLFVYIIISNTSFILCQTRGALPYYGKFLGSFSPTSVHSVKGKVYAVNETAIFIEEFSYDGAGPDAFFWAGSSSKPDRSGFIIPDAIGRYDVLRGYSNQNLLLNLPKEKTLKDIRWISVWCRQFSADFGHIDIPLNFEPPKPYNLGSIREKNHGVRASSVYVLDAKTLLLRNLHYDGTAPDAFFLVGTGDKPSSKGHKVPDENGSLAKIHGYAGTDIFLRLPRGITVMDIDWFSVFCISYNEDFGHVKILKNLNIPPDYVFLESKVEPFMSCLTIFPGLMQVSWEVRGPEIYFQLEGKVEPDQYLSFGLSGASEKPQMIGADVAVTYYDSKNSLVRVDDYTLKSKFSCNPTSNTGACPDNVIFGGREDYIMVSGNYLNGYLKSTFKRSIATGDANADQDIYPDEYATIVAAIGPLNRQGQVAYHNVKYTRSTDQAIRIAFNKTFLNRNCTSLTHNDPMYSGSHTHASTRVKGWKKQIIVNENVFQCRIGPSGGNRGYSAITGQQGWGIAWWINDKLVPEIHVKRGHNYTFIVEGGDDRSNQAKYHPFYITDNREGGGSQETHLLNTPGHRVFAGIRFTRNGLPDPSPGAGRFCELKPKSVDRADEMDSAEMYRETLRAHCDDGSPAIFTWTPDDKTPDVVYYQCFTHHNLGWKILVSDAAFIHCSPINVIFITLLMLITNSLSFSW